ncbi:phage tail tape measure protein [Burkholderia sp. JSH-S8]|nr:phage tail tape measure protein [Burkholderia sp. JSH-S8]
MDNALRLRVMFDMIDNMTRPMRNILAGNKGLAESLTRTRRELGEMAKTQKTIGAFRQMRGDLTATASRLNSARERVAELARTLRSTSQPSRQMVAEFERAKQAASRLAHEHDTQAARVRALRAQLAGAGIDTRNLAQHERELRASMASSTAALERQTRTLAELAARTERLTAARERMNRTRELAGAMAGTGAKMMAGGAAVGAVTLAPIAAYAQAEDSATQLASALMRAGSVVPPEFEKINALAMKLGDRLPGTTADFQDMMTMLTRQGISAQTVLGGMGEATAYLAVQLKKMPKEAAEFTAKLQDATRTTEKDMLSLVDVIQKAYMLGVDDNNMLNGFAKLGPAMDTIKQKGLEGAKALAPLLVMADQSGMEGSAAGNAYRKVFQLGMDSKKVAKANKQLAPAQRLDFTNGKGEFGGLDNMFAQFDKLKGLTTQKRLGVMKEIFGDDAETLQVISLMIEKGKAGYEEVQGKMAAQASMQERVNKQLGTLKNLWEAAGGTFTNGLVALGEAIAPEVKSVVEWLGNMAERMGAWARENPKLANGLMKVAAILAIVMIAMGGLLVVLAGILGPLALVRFSLAQLSFQGWLMNQRLGPSAGVFGRLSSAATRMRASLVSAWRASSPSAVMTSLKQWGQSVASSMRGGYRAVRQYTAQVWQAVVAQVAASRTAVASRWTAARQYIGRRGVSGMSADAVRGAGRLIKGGAAGAIRGVGAALGGLGQTLLFVGRLALMNPIGLVITGIALAALLIVRYWQPIKAFFSGFWQGLTNGLKPLAPLFGRVFGVLGAMFQPLKPVFTWLMNAVKGVWSWITRLLGPVDSSKESLDKASEAGKGFGEWLANIVVKAAEVAAKMIEFGANLISGLVNGITNGLGAVKDAITNVASSTVAWFKEKLGIHSPSRVFTELGGFIGEGAAVGMDGEQRSVARAALGLATAAVTGFGSPALAAATPVVQPTVPIDRRPPIAAGASSAALVAPTGAAAPIVINIYPQAGDDPRAIARAVAAELDRRERAQRSRAGARLTD